MHLFIPGITRKTFVAPCVGGPLDGRLARCDSALETFLQTIVAGRGIEYALYRRVLLTDGSTVWQFENS